jgi:hypothetical protein
MMAMPASGTLALSGKKRPAEFKTLKGTNLYLVTYPREKR